MDSILKKINNYLQKREKEWELISKSRKELLKQLSTYCIKKHEKGEVPKVTVICTHNSRRSHLGQLWLATAVDYCQLPALATYSGGTEATAFNPRAVATLVKVGFEIEKSASHTPNPIYLIKWKKEMSPYAAFSKEYQASPNPQCHFAAIMVCSEADEACPLVIGADFRLSLPFEDPKIFDGTELESSKYEERCAQIAREMLFVAKQWKALRMNNE